MSDVTRILSQIETGDPRAAEQLLPLVYDELRKLAASRLAHEKPGQTLQATALVHEAYLRVIGNQEPVARNQKPTGSDSNLAPGARPLASGFSSRGHFFAAAAEAMRRILIEQARRKGCAKRGGGARRQPLDEAEIAAPEIETDLLAMDEALTRLQKVDDTAAQLVKLRFFAGLTMDEAASALGVSARTAYYTWNYARSWLHKELRDSESLD